MKHFFVRIGLLLVLATAVMLSLSSKASAQTITPLHLDNTGASLDGPALAYCVGYIWKAWTASGSNVIYIERISSSGSRTFWATAQSSRSGPAITCATPSRLPILAWRANDSSDLLHTGFVSFLNGNILILSDTAINETTSAAPALTSNGQGTVYLGWVGTDSSQHLNLITSTDTGQHYNNVVTFTDYTFKGGGLGMSYDTSGRSLHFTWAASDSSRSIWFGTYVNTNQLSDITFSDSSNSHPGISTQFGVTLFIWRGHTNNSIYTASWSNGVWGGSHQQADTTYYAPAVLNLDGGHQQTATAFTGTDGAVDFDYGAYNY